MHVCVVTPSTQSVLVLALLHFFCSVESVDECALLCVCSLCCFTVFKELHSELHSPRLIFSLKFQALFGARGIDWDFSGSALKASSGENESGK